MVRIGYIVRYKLNYNICLLMTFQVNTIYHCNKSTHMALPSVGNPFCMNFLICLYYHKTETEAAAAFFMQRLLWLFYDPISQLHHQNASHMAVNDIIAKLAAFVCGFKVIICRLIICHAYHVIIRKYGFYIDRAVAGVFFYCVHSHVVGDSNAVELQLVSQHLMYCRRKGSGIVGVNIVIYRVTHHNCGGFVLHGVDACGERHKITVIELVKLPAVMSHALVSVGVLAVAGEMLQAGSQLSVGRCTDNGCHSLGSMLGVLTHGSGIDV